MRRTARSGSARPTTATRKDRVVVRENGVTTYFASDIAYHLHKRERGFDSLLDILGADHHGYVARVRAGSRRWASRRSRSTSNSCSSSPCTGRGQEQDVDALRAVRHAAHAARRGRQRCGALLFRHAVQRSASRFRPQTREVAVERQPGLLRAVRARPRAQRDARTRGARPDWLGKRPASTSTG